MHIHFLNVKNECWKYIKFFSYAVTVTCSLYYAAFCFNIECSVIAYKMYGVQGKWPVLNVYHRQAGDGDLT